MARPITPTPILTGKEATKFVKKIRENENKPVGLVPTPKLKEACALIKNYSEHEQKHIR